jgi:outer membrane protein
MDKKMAANDYGVPADKATSDRAAYDPSGSYSAEGGIGLSIEVTPDWLIVSRVGVERLDRQATDSPIVEQDHLFKGFAAVNYAF